MTVRDKLASIFDTVSMEDSKNDFIRKPDILYHISLNGNLPKVLKPHQPVGVESGGDYSEELPPRVSFSPSIEQCFYAIYPNVSKFFEEKGYLSMDFYVYVPHINDTVKIIPEKDVLLHVHDAYMTGEVCITSPVEITRISRIRITPTKKEILYRPFNDVKEKLRFLAPEIKVEVLETFSYKRG